MQILHVCSEMLPLLKISGLADVTGALPAAQIVDGADAHALLLAFSNIRRGVANARVVSRRDTFTGHITLLFGRYNGVGIYLIDTLHLYDRPGSPYHDTNLFVYADNILRFASLGQVGARMASGLDPFWRPGVVHARDWHAGFTPAYLAVRGRSAKSVSTVRNLACQGMFYAHHMNDIQLPRSFSNIHGPEFNGQISFPKASLYYADHIAAVNPTYVREITELRPVYGMEGLLQQYYREGRLSGVLNGVNEKVWSPETGLLLASCYARDTSEDKTENKRQLQIVMGSKVDDKMPFFTVVSCLTNQEGLDLVLETLPGLLEQGGQLVLLDADDSVLQEGFLVAAAEYPGQVGVQTSYHETFSHRTIGDVNIILVSSRFEPCDLMQLYGLKYGTLPLVRRTGGLADTVPGCSLENLADGVANRSVSRDSSA